MRILSLLLIGILMGIGEELYTLAKNYTMRTLYAVWAWDSAGWHILEEKMVIKHFVYIPNATQKLVFGCVRFAAFFLSSLAPCARTMVASSRQKNCAAALP